jgi:hypothetical protein
MRSMMLSLVLAFGALGLSLATPTQGRADEPRGPATNADTVRVARWRGGAYWGGRGFYPGYGYGYNRGFYRYGYGGYYAPYRRYYYGGGYPWGYGYYAPGYFW